MANIRECTSPSFDYHRTLYTQPLRRSEGRDPISLVLFSSRLSLSEGSLQKENIQFDDLVGVKLAKRRLRGGVPPLTNCLQVVWYPMVSGLLQSSRRRQELVLVLEDSSRAEVESCRARILSALQTYLLETYEYCDCAGSCSGLFLDRRKFLVILNPAADSGSALRVFRSEVSPVLEDAGVQTECVVTQYRGHARELLQRYDLSQVQGVLCVGGDGTVHEVVNGLMNRADWDVATRMPLSPIPCGAGNALCKTVLAESGEPFSILGATLLAVHGAYVPMDLATGQFAASTVYFFLSFSWGIIADTDQESERWRGLLGDARFTLSALKCILSHRVYEGRLHYLEVGTEYTVSQESMALCRSSLFLSQTERASIRTGTGHIHPQNPAAPLSLPSDQFEVSVLPLCPTTLMLPPLGHRISSLGWKSMEGSFMVLTPILLPYLTRSHLFAPSQRIGSGSFELCLLRERRSRLQLLRAFSGMESGRHEGEMEVLRVEAFRLEPEELEGIFSIDGEQFPVQPFQAQVLRQAGRVTCRRRKNRSRQGCLL